MEVCKNCNAKLTNKYCSNCGQKAHFERIDIHYIIHEIGHIIHFERGFPYTVKQLLVRPGKSVRNFIAGQRNKMTKPLTFLVLCGLIYKIFNYIFHLERIIRKH